MTTQASKLTSDPKITVKEASAENLPFLADGEVDMVVSGQAAHWFNYSKVWPELARVVKSGGSLAFWGYKDNVLLGHTQANKIFDRFCYGEGEIEPGLEGMNQYWERPGRDIVRKLLRSVEPPGAEWQDTQRVLYDIGFDAEQVPSDGTAWLVKHINLGAFESYVRTSSALQGWKDAHPDMKSKADGGQGDLADIMMERIVESEPKWVALGEAWRDAPVTTVWGTYILMARRK